MRLQQLLVPIVLAGAVATPARAFGRGPSTPEERAHVVRLAEEAAKDPIRVQAAEEKAFAKWLDEVPDLSFGPEPPARWCELAAKGDLRKVVRFQYAVSAVAYQIRHGIDDPRKAGAEAQAAVQQAGLEGVLRAYEALLPQNPGVKSEKMDQALELRGKGELGAFVKSLLAVKR